MSTSLKVSISIGITLAIFGMFYWFGIRNAEVEREEGEIRSILRAVQRAETVYLERNGHFTDGYEALNDLPKPSGPTLVGIAHDCRSLGSTASHTFLGPEDATFKASAYQLLQHKAITERCSNLATGFIGFAARNVDRDEGLELWIVDERGQTSRILED